jgi:hypothetical protein
MFWHDMFLGFYYFERGSHWQIKQHTHKQLQMEHSLVPKYCSAGHGDWRRVFRYKE